MENWVLHESEWLQKKATDCIPLMKLASHDQKNLSEENAFINNIYAFCLPIQIIYQYYLAIKGGLCFGWVGGGGAKN